MQACKYSGVSAYAVGIFWVRRSLQAPGLSNTAPAAGTDWAAALAGRRWPPALWPHSSITHLAQPVQPPFWNQPNTPMSSFQSVGLPAMNSAII